MKYEALAGQKIGDARGTQLEAHSVVPEGEER